MIATQFNAAIFIHCLMKKMYRSKPGGRWTPASAFVTRHSAATAVAGTMDDKARPEVWVGW